MYARCREIERELYTYVQVYTRGSYAVPYNDKYCKYIIQSPDGLYKALADYKALKRLYKALK